MALATHMRGGAASPVPLRKLCRIEACWRDICSGMIDLKGTCKIVLVHFDHECMVESDRDLMSLEGMGLPCSSRMDLTAKKFSLRVTGCSMTTIQVFKMRLHRVAASLVVR